MVDVDLATTGPDAIRTALRYVRRNGNSVARMPSADTIRLLRQAAELEASDVHIVPGYPPTYRVHGQLRSADEATLTAAQTRALVESLLPERLRAGLEGGKDFDCSVSVEHRGTDYRFRANAYLAAGEWCACLRHIPSAIPTLEWLGFPLELAQRLVSHRNGLVIVTGVVGSGKTSTLAALLHQLRQEAGKRILTIEEPIEYLHAAGAGGLITQREVGRDVDSFADGLKYGLRQDPDVVFVGEVRDRETAQMALSAAETGHLIFTTLHTRDAKGALTRLIDIFPQDAQDDIRSQLALSLRSVVCQHLLPSADEGEKRALAIEVLHANTPVQVAIRTGKIEALESALQTGKRDGMWSLDEDLQRLVTAARITLETARRFAKDPNAITATTNAWA